MTTKGSHVPLRRCVVCRERRPQGELIRLGRAQDGHLTVATFGTRSGRGAYCCPQLSCMEKTVGKKLYTKSLRAPVSVADAARLLQDMREVAAVMNQPRKDN